MSEADILKEYREAKYPVKQIKILAEQNLVEEKVMREFIFSMIGRDRAKPKGRSKAKLWTQENVEAVKKMVAARMCDADIARELGLRVETVKNLRYAYGIPVGRYDMRKRTRGKPGGR